MNIKFKWAVILITVGILFTVGGAISKILDTSGSNKYLLTGLFAHLSGFGIVVHDLIYSRKLH